MTMQERLRQYADVRRRLAEMLAKLPATYEAQVVGSALRDAGDELWIPPVKSRGPTEG